MKQVLRLSSSCCLIIVSDFVSFGWVPSYADWIHIQPGIDTTVCPKYGVISRSPLRETLTFQLFKGLQIAERWCLNS